MAKSPTRDDKDAPKARELALPEAVLVPDSEHPDYVDGTVSEDMLAAQAGPIPGGPIPLPQPNPIPLPQPFPGPIPIPNPLPNPLPLPFPFPRLCGAVSGRYVLRQVVPPIATPLLPGQPAPAPAIPLPFLYFTMTVRVDVDRFYPQHRISVEMSRRFPLTTAHVIAEVTSDRCLGFNNRRIEADVTYRDGSATLFPWTKLVFTATHGSPGIAYDRWKLEVSGGGVAARSYELAFQSRYFDPVEFEVDAVSNAGTPTTSYATGSHPNRPATIAAETLTMASVYQRAGFDTTMSPSASIIPVGDAGANGTWSDAEMHNAMITYWSRFADKPQWALWVLFAARHDTGRSLGGVMFDDIGPNHRQGTAIFTDSFIQDVPAGDANPAAWRNRMVFWTAIHEMGHAFNLAHSWQKALGTPWIPLANEPEARSFMNYPYNVSGGQAAFFADFGFRFSDNELIFMRHTPRRFVQMGNSDWFVDHGFEAPSTQPRSGLWTLAIRHNRASNSFAFMEPVKLELKLTNTGDKRQTVDRNLLADGSHISVLVAREGGLARRWNPFITRCEKEDEDDVKPGESLYGLHLVGASTSGWLIDEPGFYTIQAAVDVHGEVVVSNVLRVYVGPPASAEQSKLAPDYFTEGVARVIAFEGAPALEKATDTLREVEAQLGGEAAAHTAALALAKPMLRDFKQLVEVDGKLAVQSDGAAIDKGAKAMKAALLDTPAASAETIGHIDYFDALDTLATTLRADGDDKAAKDVLDASVKLMKQRGVLKSVISATERKRDR